MSILAIVIAVSKNCLLILRGQQLAFIFVCILGQLFHVSADYLQDLFSQKMDKTNKNVFWGI